MASAFREDDQQTAVGVRTLEAMVDYTRRVEPVLKRDLRSGDWVLISTKNSLYSICVLDSEHYSVSGGWFDREGLSPKTTTINGCTWGGTAINRDILAAPGLFLEFGNQVVTTRIRTIRVIRGGEQAARC